MQQNIPQQQVQKNSKKILIVYTDAGLGHLSLARALKKLLEHKGYNVELYDPVPNIYNKFYTFCSNNLKNVWGYLFFGGDNSSLAPLLSKLLEAPFYSKILKKLKADKYDIVISDVWITINSLYNAREQLNQNFKLYVYITDPFTVHASWYLNKDVDKYFVYNEYASSVLQKGGIAADKIYEVGWIFNKYYNVQKPSKQEFCSKYGLNTQKKLVLVGGSGNGISLMADLTQLLVKNNKSLENIQFVLNTGRNPPLQNKIEKIISKNYQNLQNPKTLQGTQQFVHLPYIKDLNLYIPYFDFLLGKAGTNFMFESIRSKKPFILFDYVPGQETGNWEYTKNQGFMCTQDLNKVLQILKEFNNTSQEQLNSLKTLQQVNELINYLNGSEQRFLEAVLD